MKELVLGETLTEQLRREAWAALPRECCGLIEGVLEGSRVRATRLHPTRNIATRAERFEIDPSEHFRLLRAARVEGRLVVGCYHSHPNGRAELSERDRMGAATDEFIWLVAALRPDAPLELAAYVSSRGTWESCALTCIPELTSAKA
jgi:proteasome lid subunit RPN8/RPN11